MEITKVNAFKDNYIWLLLPAKTNRCHCIDPGDAAPVIQYLESKSLVLEKILLTHHHPDHQGGVDTLLNKWPEATVYGPKDSRMPSVHHFLQEGDSLLVDNCNFQILEIPGHTSTHIAYYEAGEQWLFCGDTLFSAGCGRIFDGTAEQLYHSLQKIAALPPDTQVYCAHEYTRNNLLFAEMVEPTNSYIKQKLDEIKNTAACTLPSTMAWEKLINPFLRVHKPEVIRFAMAKGADNSGFSVFKHLRQEKDIF